MLEVGAGRLSSMVELANLSSIVGNLFGAGIAKFASSRFKRNGPHKYPDLLSIDKRFKDIEIKMALEKNRPKGHLAKEGLHLVCRYVLAQEDGLLDRTKRGAIVEIWEVRFGYLRHEHFSISNTAGDSGKTAVVNGLGMEALIPVYVNMNLCPYSPNSAHGKKYQALSNS